MHFKFRDSKYRTLAQSCMPVNTEKDTGSGVKKKDRVSTACLTYNIPGVNLGSLIFPEVIPEIWQNLE